MVPGAGVEPARCFHRGILSPLRLPISPPGRRVACKFIALIEYHGSSENYCLPQRHPGSSEWTS